MTPIQKTFQFGEHTVTLETGEIARQADAAVLVNMADTVVLATVVFDKNFDSGRDFFPLTVDYQEKTYAAGKIPGGFFRREGRPSEKEILTSRLIDRPIRPLFPKNFIAETQVICTVQSLNPRVDPEIPALIGTSAALAISGAPFQGPIGAARVGYKDGDYLLNPVASELEGSALDLVVAGTSLRKVIPFAALDVIITFPADDGVVTCFARQGVVAAAAEDAGDAGARVTAEQGHAVGHHRATETAQMVGVNLAGARVAVDHGPAGIEGDCAAWQARHLLRITFQP